MLLTIKVQKPRGCNSLHRSLYVDDGGLAAQSAARVCEAAGKQHAPSAAMCTVPSTLIRRLPHYNEHVEVRTVCRYCCESREVADMLSRTIRSAESRKEGELTYCII